MCSSDLTSITQGGCASRPGMVHTAILQRRLGRPVINLGFSGNGQMEAELGRLLEDETGPVASLLAPNCRRGETGDTLNREVRFSVAVSVRSHSLRGPVMYRLMSRLVPCGVVGWLCLAGSQVGLAQEKKAEARPVPQAKFPLQRLQPAVKVNAAAEAGEAYEMHPLVPPLNFEIVKVGAQGEVELKEGPLMPTPDENLRSTVMEGWFLGLMTGEIGRAHV